MPSTYILWWFALIEMPKWILSLSCIPVTKGLQAQLATWLRQNNADFEIAGSDCVGHGNVDLQGGQGSKWFPYLCVQE